jgi:3-hydroxyisobutyrate dehydrogenase-like beta-hydroxyacid dehydrogenase
VTVVAILGLGEAGSAIAADLTAAGVEVRGYDPVHPGEHASAADAARGAQFVLSLNAAAVAVEVARSARCSGEQVFADLNTAAPALKREIALAVSPVPFADVGLLGPVPGNGLHTPALVSGSGATRFADVFSSLGMPVTVVGSEPGDAAARKLVRSVFAKGLAAAVGEALAAAERLEAEEWLHQEIARALDRADAAYLERLIDGSRRHAARRGEEMAAAVAMLEDLGVEPRVSAAAEAWLRELAQRSEVSG